MKKIILIITLMTLAATANAQFVVSAQLGGSYSLGSTMPSATFYGHTPSGADSIAPIPMDTLNHQNPLGLTLGFKFGYQTGRLQFGIAASYSFSHLYSDMMPSEFNQNHILPEYRNPLKPTNPNVDYEGWFTQHQSSFMVAPYVRFEAIQVGDVAFFLEFNAYYSHVFQPIRHDFADWYCFDMHHTIDTTYHVQDSSHSLGAKIIPGLSWQLSPNCFIDLYFDVLAISFDMTVHQNKEIIDEYIFTSGTPTLANRTIVNTTNSTVNLGYMAKGISPLNPASNNWVRIGINYTF
ncbi:MAG: hypothetical protein II633_07670 [Bacteroidales bacterium]|nr:hypothetical protein [Bacteroidales bacterium]